MDGGGICRVQSETRWQRGGLQSLRMGRHADKRHFLRGGPSESHDHRRRSVSHRFRGEAEERQTPRALEGVARQIRQLDRQEGSDISVSQVNDERHAYHAHLRSYARIQGETRRTASSEDRQPMAGGHVGAVDPESTQDQGIDG